MLNICLVASSPSEPPGKPPKTQQSEAEQGPHCAEEVGALGREGPGHLSCPSCITRLETPFPSSLVPGLSGPLISQRLTELPSFPPVLYSLSLTELT